MGRKYALRREEHGDYSADTPIGIEAAKRGEAHALLEKDDLAHGPHLAVGAACSGTMKCTAFQGAA
ncbi:hypothetical protein [Stenotrophomonas rhizophila]